MENNINEQRKEIKKDFKSFRFSGGKSDDSAKFLSDFTLETGGKPLRSVIISTWRSGSSFLGDILNSINGNYYHFEPLTNYGDVQVRGPPLSIKAIAHIKQFLQCNYTGMVRDPRGIIQSRKQPWCLKSPDCADPKLLCDDLLSDFSAALRLRNKFPNSFRAFRYEDISLNPYKSTQNIFKFFGLKFGPETKKFLDTHTKVNIGNAYSTFRNSSLVPFHWRTKLSFKKVEEIQNTCKEIMNAWGYNMAFNITHQKTLNPISEHFTFNTQLQT